MTLRFIGELHGRAMARYERLTETSDMSIQLGDVGGPSIWTQVRRRIDARHHKILPGNRDNYFKAPHKIEPRWGHARLGDSPPFFFVSGSPEFNKNMRWWRYYKPMKMSNKEQIQASRSLLAEPVPLVVSHLPPFNVIRSMRPSYKSCQLSRWLMSTVLRRGKPRLWICAGLHETFDIEVEDCRFLGLGIMHYTDYDTSLSFEENLTSMKVLAPTFD